MWVAPMSSNPKVGWTKRKKVDAQKIEGFPYTKVGTPEN